MKRQSRAEQKRIAGIAAIRARLLDIALGAHGPYSYPDFTDDGPGLSAELGIEAYARYVGGIRNAFEWSGENPRDKAKWHTDLSSIEKFDTLDSGAEYLWEIGVRA